MNMTLRALQWADAKDAGNILDAVKRRKQRKFDQVLKQIVADACTPGALTQ